MPNMDGTEVLADIRRTDSTTPIVIVTAEHSEQIEAELRQQGANGYLLKPFTQKDLGITIRDLLRA